MLKNRLLYAFVVLALAVVAFFTLQLASKGGTPADHGGRYSQRYVPAQVVELKP